jgi:hypothetical protein
VQRFVADVTVMLRTRLLPSTTEASDRGSF